jgi:predicted Zn-dependent protease
MARLAPALAVIAIAAAATCSINPATGKRQLDLIGEEQEIQMGLQADKSIVAEMGLYENEELGRFVSDVAERLAAKSERPDLDWNFRVVDDPVVNAFALPGGYIYVTRGILAHFLNEAEMAGVLGHEIGHVTARHGVSQMSKAQLAQIGFGLGSILAPERAQAFGGLAQAGMGLLFLKYGRDDERQADELGLRYMVREGYDPRPMKQVFEMLDRVSAAQGGERTPGWLSTHPAPEDRKERINEQIDGLEKPFSDRGRDREDYLRRIDGIVFGDDPRQGFFEDELFLHPEMRFRIRFPKGWNLENQRQAVVGVSKEKDAVVSLELAGEESAAAALREFFSQAGITRLGSSGFRATTEQGVLVGRVAFAEHGGRVFRILGYSSEARFSAHERAIEDTLRSFGGLDDPRALAVEPRRLRIVKPPRDQTLEEFAEAFGATVPVETLALINRLEPGERLKAGASYKVVTGGPRR